jgi:lysozyme
MGQIQTAVELAVELCKKWEGFSAKPYICPAGYPTIGYGTVYKPNGTKVTLSDSPISQETAEAWLRQEITHNYMAGVLKASPILLQNTQLLAAITDFAYNLGTARYRASTLKRRVDANDLEGCAIELRKWVYGGGKKLRGLVLRREDEIALFV